MATLAQNYIFLEMLKISSFISLKDQIFVKENKEF
jgi:hypothetical protein